MTTPADTHAPTPAPTPQRAAELAANIAAVRERIANAATRAGRSADDVTLVAVSKYHPAGDLIAMAQADATATGAVGTVFGESYVQEGLPKAEAVQAVVPTMRFHFIGGLQTKKCKQVAGEFELVHSIDSEKLAREMHKRAVARERVQPVLVQINLAGEEQKSGLDPADAPRLLTEMAKLEGIEVRGLMLMPPWNPDPEVTRPWFLRMRELTEQLRHRTGLALPELSMGMSTDFEAAVEEGSTMVRVGTALFGERPTP